MRLTLQISLLLEQRLQRPGKSIAEGWKERRRWLIAAYDIVLAWGNIELKYVRSMASKSACNGSAETKELFEL